MLEFKIDVSMEISIKINISNCLEFFEICFTKIIILHFTMYVKFIEQGQFSDRLLWLGSMYPSNT